MFDHIGIGVTDLEKSKAFYLAALAPLGVEVVMEVDDAVGLGQDGAPGFWLGVVETQPTRLHIAFSAQNRDQVDEFYRCAIGAGAADNGGPGLRLDYHPNYYAAFVIGPDGHNIEAVCHKP